jgi:protein-tyrosine phosphatase
VLVLAAREFQPDIERFPDGIEVIYVPMWDVDSGPSEDEAQRAIEAASDVVQALEEGKTVLSSCAMGVTRSGLISALVLMQRYGISGREAVRRVRAGRPGALSNSGFVHWLISRQ